MWVKRMFLLFAANLLFRAPAVVNRFVQRFAAVLNKAQ
jgi:hypothetical protein